MLDPLGLSGIPIVYYSIFTESLPRTENSGHDLGGTRCQSFNRNSRLDTKQADLFYRFCDDTPAFCVFTVLVGGDEKLSKYTLDYIVFRVLTLCTHIH